MMVDISPVVRSYNKVTTKFDKNWKVVMYNDDTTTELFVVFVLTDVFEYNPFEAVGIMKKIEDAGQGVVAVLPKKLAEARVKKSLEYASDAGFSDFKVEAMEED